MNTFANESELEQVLRQHPGLLVADGEPAPALVGQQVSLDVCGRLDLLFVDAEGMPILVEAKLEKNAGSRREVVAQAIDYVSFLTQLTANELNSRVGGGLERAIESLFPDDDEAQDRTWTAVDTNLRAGEMRFLIALDAAADGLERMVRFLSERSNLDVGLVTVSKFGEAATSEFYVPQVRVGPNQNESVPAPVGTSGSFAKELSEIEEAFRPLCPPEFALGPVQRDHVKVFLPDVDRSCHYEFLAKKRGTRVEFHIEPTPSKPHAAMFEAAGKLVREQGMLGGHQLLLERWSGHDGGRIVLQLPDHASPADLARGMRQLIDATAGPFRAAARGPSTGSTGTTGSHL
jgi:hypothetical protein